MFLTLSMWPQRRRPNKTEAQETGRAIYRFRCKRMATRLTSTSS